MKLNQRKLDNIIAQTQSRKDIHGVVFQVKSVDGKIDLRSSSGNLDPTSQYYIASINKLVVSFMVHRLILEKKIGFQDLISEYLPSEYFNGILYYKGKDYSTELTIKHLLSQTSGLPCYLIDKGPDGKRNFDLILDGDEQSWPMKKAVGEIRNYKPRYRPGSRGKANYSEMNFRFLAKILEVVSQKSIEDLLNSTFEELGMKNTRVLSSDISKTAPVFFKTKKINLENYWQSTNYDISSTAGDQIRFLRAFFEGSFFTPTYLEEMKTWNKVFFPFKYGTGIEKFYIPRILSPFKKVPEIIGHAGSVGSVAFYIPDKQVYIAGTVNQTASPKVAFKILMRIIHDL